jgi:hypothetical protein
LSTNLILCTSGNQVYNSVAVPGYGNGLSVLHRLEEIEEACLGFGGSISRISNSDLLF